MQAWEDLSDWLATKHNFDRARLSVEYSTSKDKGGGLTALRDIEPARNILRIPWSALLNARTLRGIYTGEKEKELTAIQLVSLHLALHLHDQVDVENAKELFNPFIRTLPKVYSTPLWFQHGGDARLADSISLILEHAPANILKQCRDVEGRFLRDYEHVKTVQPDIVKQDYLSAWNAVNSRCIFYNLGLDRKEDNFTMCPLIDFANHTNESQVKIIREINNDLSMHSTDPSVWDESTMTIAKGTEVCFQYGAHDNATLIAEYGFALEHNQHERIDATEEVMKLFKNELSATDADERLTLLKMNRFHDAICYDLEPFEPSHGLVMALRLLHTQESDKHKYKKRKIGDSQGKYQQWRKVVSGEEEIVSTENEKAVQTSIRKLAQTLAGQAKTDALRFDDALALIPPDHRRLLAHIVAAVRTRLNKIAKIEFPVSSDN